MPIIKSAIKKMRQDKKRTLKNAKTKENLKKLIKQARRTPSSSTLSKITSSLDKAVKTKFIHKNKASRLKSRLSKITQPTNPSKQTTKSRKTKKS